MIANILNFHGEVGKEKPLNTKLHSNGGEKDIIVYP